MKACYRSLHRYKYQLVQDYVHQLAQGWPDSIETEFITLNLDILTIKKGYCWDGPSGPTWDTESSMRASLVHDAIYQLIRMGLLGPEDRAPGDRELYRICLEDKMWRIRAWAWFRIVGRAAGYAAKPGTQEDTIICVGRDE